MTLSIPIPEECPKHHGVPWVKILSSLQSKVSHRAVRCATVWERPKGRTTGKERLLVPALGGVFNKPNQDFNKKTTLLEGGFETSHLPQHVGRECFHQENPWLDPLFAVWDRSLWMSRMVSLPGWVIWLLDNYVKTTQHWHTPYHLMCSW